MNSLKKFVTDSLTSKMTVREYLDWQKEWQRLVEVTERLDKEKGCLTLVKNNP